MTSQPINFTNHQEALQFLADHHAQPVNYVQHDTFKSTTYRLDDGTQWEEYVSRLEYPEDGYSLFLLKKPEVTG